MTPAREGTIVAVATPPGRGAISLLRLSGPQAEEITRLRFASSTRWLPRKPLLGRILDTQGRPIDQVLLTYFPAPASYTGEDVVEIGCHGSPVIVREIVDSLLGAGSRLAEPGEFTLRAFLNGKIDLTQAEAVQDLTGSQTAFQAKMAAEQLGGSLSRTLSPIKEELVRILCHMETTLEFVEEDAAPEGREPLLRSLTLLEDQLADLAGGFQLGRVIHDGITVAISGQTNVGKSCLFNALLKYSRAIVTDVPGTTRDALTESISLSGIPTRLVDTAGIRISADRVEQLGVQKSREYLVEADVALFVLDQSESFSKEDRAVWEAVRERPFVLVLNKEDLPAALEIPGEVRESSRAEVSVSALRGSNLEVLKERILEVATGGEGLEREGALLTSVRHQRCIEEARRHLEAGLSAYKQGMSEEFPLDDLRRALNALGEITGETTTEDILERIFSTFCIGK